MPAGVIDFADFLKIIGKPVVLFLIAAAGSPELIAGTPRWLCKIRKPSRISASQQYHL